ncbi:MAG: hypothetical protein EBR82_51220, partial [Caulobacteraceae bacterium]|nr:hypothetical protein [Caulobacteraceae bacterium]
ELYESKNQNSIQSTVALATAFGELADSMETAVKRFEKMMAASNGWDRFWDNVKGMFGYGKADTLAETLANQLYSALDVAQKFGQQGEMQARLQQFLGIENIFDKRAFEKAIKDLGESGQAELLGIADNFKKRFQQIGSTLDGFRSNLDKTYKSTQEFTQSLSSNDPFAKMAESFGALALDMSRISTLSAGEQLKAFEELAKNPEKLSLFNDSFIKGMFDIKQAFTIEKAQVDAYTSAIDQMIRKVGELKQKQAEKTPLTNAPVLDNLYRNQISTPRTLTTSFTRDQAAQSSVLDKQIKEQEQAIQQYKNIVKEIPTTFTKASELFAQAAEENFKKAADYTAIAIQNSSTRAANTIASAWATTLTGPQAVAEQARIARSEQAIKVREAKIAVDMLDSQDSLQSAIRENTAQLEITTEALKGTPESKANIAKLEEGRNLQRAIGLISQGKSRDEVLAAIGYDPRNRSLRTDSEGPGSKAAEVFAKAQMQVDIRNQKRDVALGKLKEEQAKQKAIDVKEEIDSNAAKLQQEKQILDIINAIRQARLSIYEIDKQIAGVTTLASINAKAELEDSIRRSNQSLEIKDIDRRIKDEERAKEKATSEESKANHQQQLDFLKDQLLPLTQGRHTTEDQLAARRKILDVLNFEIDTIRKRNEVEKAQLATQQAGQEAQLEIDKARFTSMAEIYNLDKLFVANQIYQMDLQKANFDAQKQQSAALLDAKAKQEEAEKRLQASGLTGLDLENAITKEQNRQNELLNQQLQQIEIERQKRTDLLKVQQDQVTAQERMNYFMNQANTIAATLSNNFGKGGEKIGQLVDTFAKITKSIDDSRGAQEAFNKRAEQMGDDSTLEQWTKLWEDKDRLEKKSAQDELDRNAMTLDSTKKLFKEKTGAYKAFGALEKAYHIARLIMSAKEIATQIANTVSFVTQSITRQGMAAAEAGVLGVKAVINAMSTLPPPFSFAAGAAMTALVAGILSGIGKSFRGGSKNYSAPNTEDQAKYANTSMGYDDQGKLVQVRRGVVGEPEKRSESVANSISILEKNSLDGILLNSKMLQALRSIDRNTRISSVALYASTGLKSAQIPGLSQAGTFDVNNIGTVLADIAGTIAGGFAGSLAGAFTGTLFFGELGMALGGPVGAIIGAVLGDAIGDLIYSKEITNTITQS